MFLATKELEAEG